MKKFLIGCGILVIILTVYFYVCKTIVGNDVVGYMSRMYPEFEIEKFDINYDWKGNSYEVLCHSEDGEVRTIAYNFRNRSDAIYDLHLNFVTDQYIARFAKDYNDKREDMMEALDGNYEIAFIGYTANRMDIHEVYNRYKQDIPLDISATLVVSIKAHHDTAWTKEEFEDFVWEIVTLQIAKDINCTILRVYYSWGEDNNVQIFSFEFNDQFSNRPGYIPNGNLNMLTRGSISDYITYVAPF